MSDENTEKEWLAKRVNEPTPGKWCKYFEITKNYAETNGIPLIALWSNKGCGFCTKIIAKIFASDTFENWISTGTGSNYIFCMTKSGMPDSAAEGAAACKNFTSKIGGGYPFMRVYWQKSDQSSISRYYRRFGDTTKLQSLNNLSEALDSASKLITNIEEFLSGYDPTPPDVYYMVTFDANGGAVSETNRSVKENDPVGKLPEPAYSGYTFDGWWTARTGGVKVAETTPVTAETTYYARWTKYVPPDPEEIKRRSVLAAMFGLGKDCAIITRDDKILQYSAATGQIKIVGEYDPTRNLAVAKKI